MNEADMLTTLLSVTLKPSGMLAMTPPTGSPSGEFILLRTMPDSFTAFSFVHLLHHHNLLAPFIPPGQYLGPEGIRKLYAEALLERTGLPVDAEIWPLLKPLGLTRKNADEVARTRLPGYMFVSRLLSLDDDEFHSPVKLCTDPALCAAVIARTTGHYYRSNAAPDYRLKHFLQTAVVCGDSRVSESATAVNRKEEQ